MHAVQYNDDDIELIALPDVRRITGMGTTYIYTEMAAGRFPKKRKIGKRSSRWVKSEVVAWVNDQLAANESK